MNQKEVNVFFGSIVDEIRDMDRSDNGTDRIETSSMRRQRLSVYCHTHAS